MQTDAPRSWLNDSSNASNLFASGERVLFVGQGLSDREAASVIADNPVPHNAASYYFEIQIVDKGRCGYIGIGFCTLDAPRHRLPGWEPGSYGYHGDDGHIFHNTGRGLIFGPTFTQGDVIGALFNRAEKTISYFKNGSNLGIAFEDVQEEQLYPTVGLRTSGEEVHTSFCELLLDTFTKRTLPSSKLVSKTSDKLSMARNLSISKATSAFKRILSLSPPGNDSSWH